MAWPPSLRSLRARIAVAFAVGSGMMLVAASLFLYGNLNGEVQYAVNQGLRASADDIGADLRAGAVRVRPEEAFGQVIDEHGAVVASSATIVAARPVLSEAELRAASTGEIFVDRRVPGLGEDARLLARPEAGAGGARYVVVVGVARTALVRAQERLGVILAVALPVLVAALGAGGWLVAGAALHPVRRMTDEARAISLAEPGRRLPQPDGGDEIAELARTLNDMLGRIETSFARERSFVDDASHELRTPIAILRGELELAAGRPGDPEEVLRALGSALEEVDRLAGLAENLLVLARADVTSSKRLHKEPVELVALARAVSDRMNGAGPVIEVTGDPALRCSVDRVSMDQVLSNVLGNARRYARSRIRVEVVAESPAPNPAAAGRDPGVMAGSDSGGRADRAAAGAGMSGSDGAAAGIGSSAGGGAGTDSGRGGTDGDIVVRVADDGPGFPAGLLGSAFERFTRGDPARERDGGGAGLGLAIVRALVTAHGGTVQVANGAPLGGAVVVLRLPA